MIAAIVFLRQNNADGVIAHNHNFHLIAHKLVDYRLGHLIDAIGWSSRINFASYRACICTQW